MTCELHDIPIHTLIELNIMSALLHWIYSWGLCYIRMICLICKLEFWFIIYVFVVFRYRKKANLVTAQISRIIFSLFFVCGISGCDIAACIVNSILSKLFVFYVQLALFRKVI